MAGTLRHQYDLLDRLIAETTDVGTVSYAYDALGRRTSMEVQGQADVVYGYDAAGRLAQITQGPQLVHFQYDLAGRRTRLDLPNGVSTEYEYDSASQLTALVYRNAVGTLGDLTYQYDPAGNRTRVGGSFARTVLPDPVDLATYDSANRQLTFGNRALTYDLNGNLTSDGANTYTWNARNQLVGLSGPSVTASFAYDVLGRRRSRVVNGTATQFLYDGLNPVQEASGTTLTQLLGGLRVDEFSEVFEQFVRTVKHIWCSRCPRHQRLANLPPSVARKNRTNGPWTLSNL